MTDDIRISESFTSQIDRINNELTLVELSKKALAVGMDLGFNAAEVVHFIDTDTMEDLLEFTWGDREKMLVPRRDYYSRAR